MSCECKDKVTEPSEHIRIMGIFISQETHPCFRNATPLAKLPQDQNGQGLFQLFVKSGNSNPSPLKRVNPLKNGIGLPAPLEDYIYPVFNFPCLKKQ